MNKPTIKAHRKPATKRYLIEELMATDDDDDMKRQMEIVYTSTIDETHTVPTIFASGAILNKSVDINSKATIPSYVRRARSHTHHIKLCYDEDSKEYHSMSDENEEEETHISYYPSGAISTNIDKPKIRNKRRAKTHENIFKKSYNYDSIWNVQCDAMVIDHNYLIDTVMEKPCIPTKRKHKTHNVDVNDLMS